MKDIDIMDLESLDDLQEGTKCVLRDDKVLLPPYMTKKNEKDNVSQG